MAAEHDALQAWLEAAALPNGRPRVTLSYATSLDGSLALEPGRPLALSGPTALDLTHALRAAHDALLVGVGTLLADDPRLTVRRAPGPQPQPVVLDRVLRTPPAARLFDHPRRPWLACAPQADTARKAALTARGARLLELPPDARGGLDLAALLQRLHAEGVRTLMVEGGARVLTSFLRAGLADRLALTLAPRLAGGLRAVGPLAAAGHAPPRLAQARWLAAGDDMLVLAELSWNGR